jgi:hypothetical protein
MLGGSTRRELMSRMGNDELVEWLAFDRIFPTPDLYWMAAMVAFTVARAAGAKSVKFEDFLPQRNKPRRQTGAEMAGIIHGAGEAAEREKR